MKSSEHCAVGDAATAGALVDVGGDCAEERCVLSYGDVVALSGDFFTGSPGPASDDLFRLAAIPGKRGTTLGTRDEVVCALKVMAVDGASADARFEPGGEFSDFRFTATAANTEVERRVRDRFLALATANGDHFVAPGRCDTAHCHKGPPPSRFESAVVAYHRLHEVALDEACRLGRCRGDESRAMAREAAAQHYLTDAFAAGHLRTPVTAIRHFWDHRYPWFWQSLQRKVAMDTALALRELARPARILPGGFLDRRVHAAVKARTSGFPADHPRRPVGPSVSRLGQHPRPHPSGRRAPLRRRTLRAGRWQGTRRCGCPLGHRRYRDRLPARSVGQPSARGGPLPAGPIIHRCPRRCIPS